MSRYVLSFTSAEADLARVGGKAANLALLTRAGFPVPPGFFVTTDAYRAFVDENRISASLLALAQQAKPDDPRSLADLSQQIRALFERRTIPDLVAAEISSAYRELADSTRAADPPVAVRSSATMEDLPGLSFAGQQETFLNVVGAAAVLNSIVKCWASLWTARAIGYRARNHIPPDNLALAVVVQQLIASEVSGVAFTANPVTGRRSEAVIDASFGLGEAIVSGQVNPDHYVVDTTNWQIAARSLGDKALSILPRAGGGTETVAAARGAESALSDDEVIELARTARRVADYFGSPQDIEWARAAGRLVILQSRPITSLYPLPERPAGQAGLRIYFCLNAVQGLPDPISPLGQDVLRLLLSGPAHLLNVRRPVADFVLAAGGRLFIDITELAADPRSRGILRAIFSRADASTLRALERLLAENRITRRRTVTIRRLLSLLPRLRLILPRALAALRAPERMRARLRGEMEVYYRRAVERIRSASDLGQLLGVMNSDIGPALEQLLLLFIPQFMPAFGSMPLVDRWLVEWLGEPPGRVLTLVRGVEGNVTTEMDLKLWAAAQEIRDDPASNRAFRERTVEELAHDYRADQLPRAAQLALGRFLDEYGMRALAEIDIYRPRWRDDPMPILQTLKSYLQLQDPALAPDAVFRRGEATSRQLIEDYRARIRRLRFGSLRARLFAAMVRRMRVLGAARETPKFYIVKLFQAYRTALLLHGQALAAKGDLERAEDIFFLRLADLDRLARGGPDSPRAGQLQAQVAAARTDYSREMGRRQLPRLLRSTGEAFYEEMEPGAAGPNLLLGDPVSPGSVEGPVRVVLEPTRARLDPGDILVCRATDPGWTPLFLTAGGLVMEIGGMMTHGSVVAREYGIPAVVGVHDATRRLKTGDRVHVDGSLGQVVLLEPAGGNSTEKSPAIAGDLAL